MAKIKKPEIEIIPSDEPINVTEYFIDDMAVKSSDRISIFGKTGSGKCLTKNSLVLTDNGLVKIEDIIFERTDYFNENIYHDQTTLIESLGQYVEDDAELGTFVYSDNIKNIKNVISLSPNIRDGYKSYNISARYDMGMSDVIKIKTNIGLEITGTHEHKIVVINKDGNLTFKRLDKITKEDYVAISNNTNIYNDKLRLNFVQQRQTNANFLKNIEYINEDIARLLGYVISEANADFNKSGDATSFLITTYDKEMQDDIINICDNLGLYCGYLYVKDAEGNEKNDGNPSGIRISSKNFSRFMYYLGYRHLAQNKEVPWSILQADKKSQLAFLGALFDGDGTIQHDSDSHISVVYGSSSYELCRQIQIMLLNIGIICRLREVKGAILEYNGEKRFYEKSYTLSIYGENLLKYDELIGFGLTRKRIILDECVTHLEDTERWTDITIPFIQDKLKILYDKLILLGQMRYLKIYDNDNPKFVTAKYYLKYHDFDLLPYTKKEENFVNWRQPSKLTLNKILKILSPIKTSDLFKNDKNIISIFNYLENISDLFIFDKVQDIDKGRENVYDVTIDPVHSYIANGMINHNTTITSTYLLPHYDNYIFWDIKWENDKPGTFKGDKVVYDKIDHSPEELAKDINRYNRILYQPNNPEVEDFNEICRIIFLKKNRLLYVDEASRISSPSKIPYWMTAIMTQGRSFNVGVINASQRPHSIHNTMISEANHLFLFQLNLKSDRDKIAEIIGYDTAEEIKYLPEFHFIYYNMNIYKGAIYSLGESKPGEIPKLERYIPTYKNYLKIVESRE